MDFSVKDFNVRLRTIKIWEAAIAIFVSLFLTILVCNFLLITNDQLPSIIFDLFIMIFFVFALLGTRGFKKDLDEVLSPLSIFRIVLLCVIYSFFEIVLLNFIPLTSVYLSSSGYNALGASSGFDIVTIVLEFILTVFIAPIAEELLFRAVLFNRLKIRRGVYFGLIVSSLIFGAGHFYGDNPLMHVVTATIFGMFMCALYLKTDNIMMCMGVHVLSNFGVYFLQTGILDFLLSIPDLFPLFGLLFLLSLIFVPAYIIYYANKFST